jgi:hypothetical protein
MIHRERSTYHKSRFVKQNFTQLPCRPKGNSLNYYKITDTDTAKKHCYPAFHVSISSENEEQLKMKLLREVSLCFAAGAFGALVNSWLVWHLGTTGIPQHFGVAIAPKWSLHFLYPRVVWGGLWGLIFALPIWRGGFWVGVFSRGILLSLIPTLFQLFYVFPVLQGKGTFGLALGKLTPVFVFIYNAVWGLVTALWLHITGQES